MVAILNNKMASTDRDCSPFYNSVFSVMAEDRPSILKIDFQIIIKYKIKTYENLFLKTLF